MELKTWRVPIMDKAQQFLIVQAESAEHAAITAAQWLEDGGEEAEFDEMEESEWDVNGIPELVF